MTRMIKMGFQPLPSFNGKHHLPINLEGKYLVGTTDLMTSSNSSNVFLRCYYPVKSSTSATDCFEHADKWTPWLPSLQYADGYMRFKFSNGIPLVARLFRWLIHNPFCPIIKDAQVMKMDKPLPVIVFSHGMGAMRTTYSLLLTRLASEGYFVAAVGKLNLEH